MILIRNDCNALKSTLSYLHHLPTAKNKKNNKGCAPHPEVHLAALEQHWLLDVLLHHSIAAWGFPVARDQLGGVCQAHICAVCPLRKLHHPVVVLPSLCTLHHAHRTVCQKRTCGSHEHHPSRNVYDICNLLYSEAPVASLSGKCTYY